TTARFPSAAIEGRSACTSPGLTRFGLPHAAGTAPDGERWTNTPIFGERSVAQAPEGGGQSLAHADRSRPPAVASDSPGFRRDGAEAACQASTGPGRATPARHTTEATTANARR